MDCTSYLYYKCYIVVAWDYLVAAERSSCILSLEGIEQLVYIYFGKAKLCC